VNTDTYLTLKMAVGAFLTIGLYSMLYRENKLYRLCEHIFLGLASGYSLVALWTETLKSSWYDSLVGTAPDKGSGGQMGYWSYALLLPIGLMAYLVFSKKHNWISRIPIGIIIGLYSGQQFQAWQTRYIGQIRDTVQPIVPTTSELFKPSPVGLSPAQIADVNSKVYISDALSNLIFVGTVVCVISYFLFSFEQKNKILIRMSLTGRWLLMIGFGAIFGSTVMMRFALLIDRMAFVFDDFLKQRILHAMFGIG
jgi:hypothetical protein